MEDFVSSLTTPEPIACNAERDIAALVLSVILTIGMFVSYLPQVNTFTH
jgi:hypothetical protein